MIQPSAIVNARSTSMLQSALGPAIAGWLDDVGVAEVMLNADGRLWVDRLDTGMVATGEWLSPTQAERIIRLVAHHVGAEVHRGSPRVSAELPGTPPQRGRTRKCEGAVRTGEKDSLDAAIEELDCMDHNGPAARFPIRNAVALTRQLHSPGSTIFIWEKLSAIRTNQTGLRK